VAQQAEPMDVDEPPSPQEIREMIKRGEFLKARRYVFSKGAQAMLENGER